MSFQDTIDTNVASVNAAGARLAPLQQPMQVLSGLPTETVFGPQYDYSGEMNVPGAIGIRLGDGSWSGIKNAASGVDYYGSVLGYGTSAGMAAGAGMPQHPMGLNFFVKTGGTCSNGADMYDYVSTIPTGVPGRLGREVKRTLGVNLQGLAPGVLDDAAAALNPLPLFDAMIGTGFAKCKKISLPVGDAEGALRSKNADVAKPWINTATTPVTYKGGRPYESHWVFDSWISGDEYDATPKVYAAEGFCGGGRESGRMRYPEPRGDEKTAAGFLLGALVLGLVAFQYART